MAGLPLDLLAPFVRTAELASFTAAARDLGVSKATISKQIAALEAVLGAQLFSRTTRRLSLTEAGERAFARASAILEEAEALAEEAADAAAHPRGRLKVAAPLTFAQRYLAEALPDFLKSFPEIRLELSLDDRTIDLVGEGYDAALRISEMPDSSLTARRLAPVRSHVVAAPSYWAARGRPRRPEDLALHACIRYANLPSGVYWRFLGPEGEEARVRVEGPLCVNNGDVELPALRAGLGVARLPDFIIAEDVRAGRLELALEDWRAPDLWLHVLSPPGRAATRKLKAFTEFLLQRYGQGRAPWPLG